MISISKISFFIPALPPSQNQLLRMHWGKRRALQFQWDEEVFGAVSAQGYGAQIEQCEIEVTFTLARQMDRDNATARCRLILDALKHNQIITDDNPKVVTKLTALQNINGDKKQHGTLIEIFAT